MDFLPIINQVASILWYLIPAAILAAIIRSPWFKGAIGEFVINFSAKRLLDSEHYHLIKSVTLPTEDGGTTQIDHIIVSIYGIFVVETKNMKGWIFGSENQKVWTQKIFKQSHKFQNPLHQNHKHLKTLAQLLELDEQNLHSVVVFVGDSTFKNPMPANVTYGKGYLNYIKSKTDQLLTLEQVSESIQKIESGRFPRSISTHRKHVKHVQSIIAEKENSKLCPKCGSTMLRREIQKGQNKGQAFWGCSKFPKCRGTLNTA